jgi:hypothetical protein
MQVHVTVSIFYLSLIFAGYCLFAKPYSQRKPEKILPATNTLAYIHAILVIEKTEMTPAACI